mmetsp:Transcript_8349/g.11850  ORF Transcript_8349/g.11850 Transcript_8349/m.11850 type:complete len:145 (+) Transcript_8349:96-530(+)
MNNMIMLPIRKAAEDDDDDTPAEWSLLELNGEIVPPKSEPEEDGMELGKVQFDAEGTPVMTIASHELRGKVQHLKQPFVIMKPTKKRVVENECDQSSKRLKLDGNSDTGNNGSSMDIDEGEGYEVAGIVTSKILFDRYPKSIMR